MDQKLLNSLINENKFLLSEGRKDPVGLLWGLFKKHSGSSGLLHLRVLKLNLVFVGDFQAAKYIFNHRDVQDRLFPNYADYSDELRDFRHTGSAGIVFNEGQSWQQLRRFTLKTLKEFGFGKAGMQELVMEEVKHFLAHLKESNTTVDMSGQLPLPILNSLWRVAVGERFNYDDPRLISIMERLGSLFRVLYSPLELLGLSYPWLLKLPFMRKLLGREQGVRVCRDIIELMREKVREHEEIFESGEPRDFIDVALVEINTTSDPTSSFYGDRGREQLVNILFDLFVAGSETTSTTLSWAVLYMLRHPDVQAKVQSELDKVVGRGRLPTMADRQDLPYTEATLMEVQRHASILPTGLAHYSRHSITVNGMKIPPDTVYHCLYAEVLRGNHWEDGTTFRPSRFIGSDGLVRKDEHLIPFSVGKRQCPGENLAR